MSWEAWGDPDDVYWNADQLAEAGWISPDELTKAFVDVLNERVRQTSEEGWTSDHDDTHDGGEMARAAACYALVSTFSDQRRADVSGSYSIANIRVLDELWPWSSKFWKPKDRRRDLVRAAALMLAEIERLDRAAEKAVEP